MTTLAGHKIIRVFPRRTSATPDDAGVRVNVPPGLYDEADEVHISVSWTYDLRRAEQLERMWRHVAPVLIGGPAIGEAGGDFSPGMYIKRGYVITSRGCPNRCWFCSVWRREGEVRELPVTEGWNLLDDNILACSDAHIKQVFDMLSLGKQTFGKRPQLTGGLEAARLKPWHVQALRELRPKQIFFAYDTQDDLEPLAAAGRKLLAAGFTVASKVLRCYVLCGFAGDSFSAAEQRMHQAISAGFWPMAMLWRGQNGATDPQWRKWQRQWARPAIMGRLARV